MKVSKDYFRGCLLGGAIGDALGYPVNFLSLDEIMLTYGELGVQNPVKDEITGKALISDDSQLTIFTVDGLLWADSRIKKKGIYAYIPCLFYAYQKWYYTQTGNFADRDYEFLKKGEVFDWEELFARRTPDEATLEALKVSICSKYGTLKNSINDCRSYGAAARSAPIGMYFYNDPKRAFQIGCEGSAITHGHADGFLPAGFIACLMAHIFRGERLEDAVSEALAMLKRHKNSEAVYEIIDKAVLLARSDADSYKSILELGEGWTGDEAAAIAIYCALKYQDSFENAIRLAVNHNGNSSGPAAICGNILGGYLGSLELPFTWTVDVELSALMVNGADKLLEAVIV